jgi:hypothetical protein
MERITAKEAEQFVPLKKDFKSDITDATYFTLTPSDTKPGWEDGYTSHEDVDKRVKQLSRSTSVATPFTLEWAFRCFNAERLEGEVHQALKGHRIAKDREFFAISLNEAKETIQDLGEKYI